MSVKLRGEYWIVGSDLRFADGDSCDSNHNCLVMDNARALLIEKLGAPQCNEEFIDEDSFKTHVETFLRSAGSWHAESDFDGNLASAAKPAGVGGDLLEASMGKGDLRDFAMREWGWKWMRQNEVATWNLGAGDVADIRRGVGLAAESEGIEDDVPLSIRVASTERCFETTLDGLGDGIPRQSVALWENPLACTNSLLQIDRRAAPACYSGQLGD